MRALQKIKKRIHSGDQAAFASRQLEDTHHVKVGRGREAASLLRRQEEEEEEGGRGFTAEPQQMPKQPDDSSTYTH